MNQPHPFKWRHQVAQPTAAANPATSVPRVINVEKNAAYPKAMAELKAAGQLAESGELRQVKYLNNIVEQDHRFIKRLVKPGMGFFSFETAGRTLQGYGYECPETLSKRFTSRTRTVPPRFLSFISVFSQVQLRELSYTSAWYIKTEALATASSKAQRN